MLRKILTAFIVPKIIAYLGRRYGGRAGRRGGPGRTF
ncbi:hypothetical protein ABIE45_005555 [Methylobacterium sp. OAE515]|jgi:hypothetical protein